MAIYIYMYIFVWGVSMRTDCIESEVYIQKHYFLTTSSVSSMLKKNSNLSYASKVF